MPYEGVPHLLIIGYPFSFGHTREKKSGVASYYGHEYNQGQEARLLFSDQCHPGSTYILRGYSIGFNGSYHIPFGGLRVLDNNDFMFFNPNHPTPCCRLQGNHSRL
ncbi:hypothetical protein L2E82_11706 [Cichorium intybus]|uniref:Uncharacterized protein n=1 Tax=Cichorium intybus TaxID=13427 RepID=A0ACB9GF79_CICIN|nr:hypothetical protein L2E82_11706 [Cichorium intybus]